MLYIKKFIFCFIILLISLFVLGAVSGAQETDSAPHETVLPSGQGLFIHLREELAWLDFPIFVLEIAKDVLDPLHIVASELINLTDANRDVVTLDYKPIHDPIKGFYERRTGNDFEKGRDDSTLLDTVVFMADLTPTLGKVIKVLFVEKDLGMLNPIDEIKEFHARQSNRFDTSIRFIFGLPKKSAEKNKLESQEGINEIDPNADLHMDEAVPEEGTEEAAKTCAALTEGTIEWRGGTYTGELRDCIPHGQGQWIINDLNKYVGEFNNGERHGYGTIYNPKICHPEGVQYVGDWKNDKRNGYGEEYYTKAPYDNWYVGEFKDDKRHGHGTLYISTTQGLYTEEGEFRNGKAYSVKCTDSSGHSWHKGEN